MGLPIKVKAADESMKPERFKRTKSVMASGAIALVVAALVIGVSSLVVGPRSASPQHVGFDLTSGSSSFTITSNVYAQPGCSGPTASLYPGTTRCAVFTVQNLLDVPITVQSITSALDTTDYPAPPADCSGTNLVRPTFSGSLNVPADGEANSPGVPIELADNGAPQNDCKNLTYHFTYSGSAQYTDSTTTSLGSSPNPSTSGQSVTFTATVTASNPSTDGASPTSGTVTFYSCGTGSNASTCATPTTELGTGTVGSNSQATYATSSLPVGKTYVEAIYGGSGTDFTGGTSSVVTQTVTSGSISTTSVLTSSPNPSSYGTSVGFTDAVSASTGTPGGTVTFYSCTTNTCSTKTSLGTGTLASGKATYSTSSLPLGTTYVEAIYSASGNYAGSTSNVVTQVVNALGTTSVLTSSPNPSSYGTSVGFTDTVSAASGTPGGTVTFYSCTTNTCSTATSLGTETLASGKATYSTATLPVGTTYVEAIYSASGNYAGSTSNVVTQVVNPLSTTSVLTSSLNPSSYGTSVGFTDAVSASTGTPGGTVTFYSCTTNTCSTKTSLGTGTLASGKATYSTSSLPLGTTYVEAIYSASGNYAGSTSNVVTQVVNALGTTSVLTSSPNPSSYGTSVGFTDTVSAASGTPGGTVTFYSCTTNTCSTATSLGTETLASGKATYSTATLPVGTTYVEAIYSASGNYAGSTSNVVTQVVNPLSTTSVLTSSLNPSSYGTSVGFTDAVSASTGTPGGTVTFYSCTTNTCSTKTSLGTGTLASGKATYSTSSLPLGTTYVEAIYSASGNYAGSTSNVVTQVVNALGTTSVLTSSPNPSSYGTSVGFTDTVSAASGTPGGTVTFYSCTTNTCSTATSLGTETLASGKATYSTATLPVGTTYVEAIYSASGNYAGSTSNVVTQVVNPLSTTSVLTSSPNPSSYGTSVGFTDTVSASTGTPGGTVTFYSCTTNTCSTKTSLGTGTLASGKATYSTSSLPLGTTYVEAIYSASGNYAGSTSNVVTQVVNALGTTSVLTSSPNPSSYGTSVGFTDTVSAASGTPGGTVTFYSCTTNTCSTATSLGTETLASGKATYSTATLPVGTTYVEAIYSASGNYAGSTSNVVTQVVIGVPSVCTSGSYGTPIIGNPANPFIYGTNGNDFIYAFGGSYWIEDYNGNNCIDVGDGNNIIFAGDGNDGVSAGDGSNAVVLGDGNDKVSLGNGSDGVVAGNGTDTVTFGNGSDDAVNLGNGSDSVTIGNGSNGQVTVGNGTDSISVGTGSYNGVQLGSGTDTVTVAGSNDTIDGGNGNETIYLGSGTYNSYSGVKGKTNVCHLPLYKGKAGTAADYHDTITNCTVVSP